jgi:uncharacterized membrane protein YqaE (UPF0057 family)
MVEQYSLEQRIDPMKLLPLVLAILIPPVGVFMTFGVGPTLFINILLTLLGWIPGSIHAVWAIAKQDSALHQSELHQSELNKSAYK